MEQRADYIRHERSVYWYNYSQTAKLSILKILSRFRCTMLFNAFSELREQAVVYSRQSTLSTGSGKISGRTVLLIQSESSYANVLRNIRREISRIPFAFRGSNFYTFHLVHSRKLCTYNLRTWEPYKSPPKQSNFHGRDSYSNLKTVFLRPINWMKNCIKRK